MKASIDRRGPVVVVEQWWHMHGPELWFPYSGQGARRREVALRSAAAVITKAASREELGLCTRGVFVQERGQWVPA